MWASLLAGLLARPWARRAAALALVALTITLFVLNLRRSGERAGRAADIAVVLGRAIAGAHDQRLAQPVAQGLQLVERLGMELELTGYTPDGEKLRQRQRLSGTPR